MYFFSPGQGVRLARAQCAECHLVAGPSPNPAAPTFEHIANIPGITGMALTAALRTSHGTMPNVIIKGRRSLELGNMGYGIQKQLLGVDKAPASRDYRIPP
jgi:hypothetical protein